MLTLHSFLPANKTQVVDEINRDAPPDAFQKAFVASGSLHCFSNGGFHHITGLYQFYVLVNVSENKNPAFLGVIFYKNKGVACQILTFPRLFVKPTRYKFLSSYGEELT